MSDSEPKESGAASDTTPVIVKKYANRRLYNTESSSYITLDSLAEMVRVGRDFVVYDAKTGDDITRSVLTQIIVEEEGKGSALLPTGFLRQLIGFYGNSMQGLVPRYLEQALTSFGRQQQQMRSAMQTTMGPFFPFGIEEVGRQNMAMMERAMSLFTPFYRGETAAQGKGPEGKTAGALEDVVATLEAEVESLRGQLAGALVETARVHGLQDDVLRQKTRIEQLEAELSDARAGAARLEARIPVLEQEAERLRAEAARPAIITDESAVDDVGPVPPPINRGTKRGKLIVPPS